MYKDNLTRKLVFLLDLLNKRVWYELDYIFLYARAVQVSTCDAIFFHYHRRAAAAAAAAASLAATCGIEGKEA